MPVTKSQVDEEIRLWTKCLVDTKAAMESIDDLVDTRSEGEKSVTKLMNALNVPQSPSFYERVLVFAASYQQYADRVADLTSVKLPAQSVTEEAIPREKLSDDQSKAWVKITRWLSGSDPFFVLRGYAGTGKTYLMRMLLDKMDDVSIRFTAPTNKATKVLSSTLKTPAVTIYSLLGLKMVTHEDGMRLEFPENPPPIARGTVIVIDEASMISTELHNFIRKAQEDLGCRFIYVGDPAQLNPVGEPISPAWKAVEERRNNAMLKKVMRFDNELLALSMEIRSCIKTKNYRSPIVSNNNGEEGVFVLPERKFEREILRLSIEDYATTKVVCWRNKTVNRYNEMIREKLGFKKEYEDGEVVLLAEPIEMFGNIVGHVDEEGVLSSVIKSEFTLDDNVAIPCWTAVLTTDEKVHRLRIPLKGDDTLERILGAKAAEARNERNRATQRRLWKDFWEVKRTFHAVRYGYAITAHRVQGTTLETAFVDQEDILANRDKREAFRCLYVACTRPTTRLITY